MHLHLFRALGCTRAQSWQVFSYAQVQSEWCLFVGLDLGLSLCRVKGWGLSEAGWERPGPLPAPIAWDRSLSPFQVSLIQEWEWKACAQLRVLSLPPESLGRPLMALFRPG